MGRLQTPAQAVPDGVARADLAAETRKTKLRYTLAGHAQGIASVPQDDWCALSDVDDCLLAEIPRRPGKRLRFARSSFDNLNISIRPAL